MTRKADSQEPLLNAVARRLGQAAGTLANMTHRLTTEPATGESHSPSRPESVNSRAANTGSANSGLANPELTNNEKSTGNARPDRKTKQGHATRKKQAAKAGTASRRNTIRTKSSSRRKP